MPVLAGISTPSVTVTSLLREMFEIVTDIQRDRVYLLSRKDHFAIAPAHHEHALLALDWLVRTYTPSWLMLAGLNEHARALQGISPILDLDAATTAGGLVRLARQDAQQERRALPYRHSSQVIVCGRSTTEWTAAGSALHIATTHADPEAEAADAFGALAAAEAAAAIYIAQHLPEEVRPPNRLAGQWIRQFLTPIVDGLNGSMLDLMEQQMAQALPQQQLLSA